AEADPRAMAILLAELSSEIGAESLGILEIVSVHRPEAQTKLVPLEDVSAMPRVQEASATGAPLPTRLLPTPVELTVMPGRGLTVSIDNQLFSVLATDSPLRIDQVEWWTSSPVCRDYFRAWLSSGKKNVEAWVFTDRTTGRSFLHGYYD
ncbi:MAG TPA: hypothetical protein VJT73_16420, partial [Polyangiaceae bacterium]|nr:hypothetical protein [Polyangiaceae bacterium]